MGIGAETNPPATALSVVLLLGYFNFAVNPILYLALNRNFRRAYEELLCCMGLAWRHTSTTICVSLQKRVPSF